MSNFRIRETGEVVSQGELRRRHWNTSFPSVWDQGVFEHIGIDPIFVSPQPENTDPLKTVRQNGVVQDSNGNWVENWEVVDMFADTTVEGVTTTKAQHEETYITARNATQWTAIRSDRDTRLKETDWVSIRAADTATPMSAEWAAYRQALRDITTQTDPFSITWPTKP
tara:strand:- start:90 stop:593 length:504 start_codon:yes stop_codon:yes gene_type:complete